MNVHLQTAIGLAFAAVVLTACASGPDRATDGAQVGPNGETIERIGPTEAVPWAEEITDDHRRAGMVLADIDRKVGTWVQLVLRGQKEDVRTVVSLEDSIRNDVRRHLQTVIDELAGGPVRNRRIAAAALGFADRKEVLGSLLAAVEDRDQVVVANALLGISILRVPDTPIARITEKFRDQHAPIDVRNNAGRALRTQDLLALEGLERDLVLDAARFALVSDESAVRVHGLLILATMLDTDSIGRIEALLDDETALVAQAASRSLAYIGSEELRANGAAARALAKGADRIKDRAIRAAILGDLQRLTKRNYGEDIDEWLKYAHGLP